MVHRYLGLAAFVDVTSKTVHPLQQPVSVCFGFFVKFLQKFGGHSKVILKTTVIQDEFVVKKKTKTKTESALASSPASMHCWPSAASC